MTIASLKGIPGGKALSRMVMSRLALGAEPYQTLFFCSLGACAGALLAAVAPSPGVAAFAIALCGLFPPCGSTLDLPYYARK